MSDHRPKDVSALNQAGGAPPDNSYERHARALEAAQLGLSTLLINRFFVQTYSDGGVRITFAEQFSPSLEQPPASRTAIFLHKPVAIDLAKEIARVMGLKLVPQEEPHDA